MNFDPILTDYAFFESHSTEARSSVIAYAGHFEGLPGSHRMLDFGSGSGTFTKTLLQILQWSEIDLTIIEPGDVARDRACTQLRPIVRGTLRDFAELHNQSDAYDVIISNHVLYFVTDLSDTVESLMHSKAPGGKCLIALAGRENFLVQCWQYAYDLIGEPVPFHVAEDLEPVLRKCGQPFQRSKINYTLSFNDSSENRMKLLRFLFGQSLSDFPIKDLTTFFGRYACDGNIVVYPHCFLYVI